MLRDNISKYIDIKNAYLRNGQSQIRLNTAKNSSYQKLY
jgi:hypothetical protein